MAIDSESARFLLSSVRKGVSYRRCLSLGRQHLLLSNREVSRLLRENGFDPANHSRLLAAEYPQYSEALWEALGAQKAESMDASGFEGASIVHDLNVPVPESLKEQFDAVCDAGTLEHVFNLPVALRNCMEMVKVGGHFLAITPANNFFGHGFYQFSPELFFRVLSPENGFQMERMVAVEYGFRRRWFEVSDPEAVRARVALINSVPVMLFLQAKRIAAVPVLAKTPQQSDYVAIWTDPSTVLKQFEKSPQDWRLRLIRRIKRVLLETCPSLIRSCEALRYSSLNEIYSFRNRTSFRTTNKKRL